MSTRSTSAALDQWREAKMLEQGAAAKLADLSWKQLKAIEIFPGCKLGDPILEVPEHYLPAGAMRRPNSRRIDPSLSGKLVDGLKQSVAAKREENVRRALLILWLPHTGKRGRNGLGPSSWLTMSGVMLRAIIHVLKEVPPDSGNIWLPLHIDRQEKISRMTSCERTKRDFELIYQRLKQGANRGLLPDFLIESPCTRPPAVEASHKYDNRINESERNIDADRLHRKEHFDDDFVVEIISRAIWIIKNIATPCILCLEETERACNKDPSLSYDQKKYLRNSIVANFNWDDHEPVARNIPFAIRQRTNHQKYTLTDNWPPQNYGTLILLVGLIQALNFTITAFCTAARHHEIAGADDDLSHSRLHATTRKMEPKFGGRERDWPLHPIAESALAIQRKLASVVKPEGSSHLWVQLKNHRETARGGPLANMTEPMVYAVDHLGLTDLVDGRPHAHRWRHTVTRLVALTISDSMQVLLDLLGHRDLENLLNYVLSDPEISSEVMKTTTEAAIVLAEQAIHEVLSGTAGGLAAPHIKDGLEGLAMRRGIGAFATDDVREAAVLLTSDGAYWELVRPGVICTRSPWQYGPCTKGRGRPDKGACRADCVLRLELELAKAECRAQLKEQLVEYTNFIDQPLVASRLEGTILANLHRWEDVRREILDDYEVARRIWSRNK